MTSKKMDAKVAAYLGLPFASTPSAPLLLKESSANPTRRTESPGEAAQSGAAKTGAAAAPSVAAGGTSSHEVLVRALAAHTSGGTTQAQVAASIGVCQNYLSKWKTNGGKALSAKVAAYLGLPYLDVAAGVAAVQASVADADKANAIVAHAVAAKATPPDASALALQRTPLTAPRATADPMEAVRGLLVAARLEQYVDAFEAEGYDDYDYLLDLAEQPESLKEPQRTWLAGHAARFV